MTKEEFTKLVNMIIEKPSETKELEYNQKAYWDDESGFVVIYDPRSPSKGTCFSPREGKLFFDCLK